jgi:hypothetical protein
MKKEKTKGRIYVCHTYYHVYVSILKEMKIQREMGDIIFDKADIVLSKMSTDFENLGDRLEKSEIFNKVIILDEKHERCFPELAKYRANYHNKIKHMVNRIIFTKRLAKCEIPYMDPVGFEDYKDIYVYCDSDPVGYYLNYRHIYYHAVEDGLDTLKNVDDAYVANYGNFKLKAWFSRHNLIFIMNGWGKYCLDMEINDLNMVNTYCPNFVEIPRKPMEDALTSEQRQTMVRIFIEDCDLLMEQFNQIGKNEDIVCILTEPHPTDEEVRKQVCLDIIERYCGGYKVFIKPHPRDLIDYEKLCPDAVVLRGRFPIEVLNFLEGIHIKKAISIVTTAMDGMDFVDEKINLGASFWDEYEDVEKHAYNKKAGLALADE